MSRRFILFYALVSLLGVSVAAYAASPASENVRAGIQKLNVALESGDAAAANSLLPARRNLLTQLIREDPQSVRSVGLAPDAVERLRSRLTGVEAFIEQEGEWTGSLEVIAEMDFEHHTSTTHRFIRSANGRLELFGGPRTFGRTDRMGGAQMRVKGIRSEALIAVDSITTASAPAPLAPVGVQNYAVLVVTSPANPTFPRGWDISSIQNIFFGTAGSTLNTFWQEASYGLTSATGQVFGPFALTQNYTCTAPDTSDSETLRQSAIAAAMGAVDFTQFNRIAIVFPDNSCSYGGLATIGGGQYSDLPNISSTAWFPIFNQETVASYVHILAHEGGHNLGLNHGNSEDYGNVPLGAPGTDGVNTEYGDPYTVMGVGEGGSTGPALGQYSAQHKASILGWLDATGFQEVTSSGTYNVAPLEESGGTRGLRVLRDQTTQSWLWIESRQPLGTIDSTLSNITGSNVFSGALIHFENPDLDSLHTYLLDFNPVSTPNNFNKSAMTPGQSWSDPYSMLSLTLNSSGTSGLSMNVNYDSPCATLAVSGNVIPVAGGSGAVQVTAPASCSWTASTGDSWITLGTTSGQGNGSVPFTADLNTGAAQRGGVITVQRQSVQLVQQGPGISIISVSPNSGSGTSASFTFQLADTNGYAGIEYVEGVIGPSPYDTSVCSFQVNATRGVMFLQSSTGDFLGPISLNAPGKTLSNGACAISTTGSSVSGSGELLSVTVNVQFSGTVTGTFSVFSYAADTNFTPPFLLGSWTIPGAPVTPAITSLAPSNLIVSGSAFTLAVNGTGFVSGTAVLWNGTPIPTTYVSPAQLTATVDASLAAGAVTASISVSSAGVLSSAAPISISAGTNDYYFSHLSIGGGWQTTLTLINYSTAPVTCTTSFFSDLGTPLPAPFAEGTNVSRSDSLQPGQSLHDQTIGSFNALALGGWAHTSCTGPVQANLLYRLYDVHNNALAEAGVNAENAPTTKFVTFAQSATGVAYANPSASQSAMVTFTVFNAAGSKLGSTTIAVPPLQHGAFLASAALPAGAGSFTGSIVIASAVPILSLSLNAEAFTAAHPVISSMPPGDLPASGASDYYFSHFSISGGWQTTLTLINYSAAAITCATSFFSDSGTPLMVPFTRGTSAGRTDVLQAGQSIHDQTTGGFRVSAFGGWAHTSCTGQVQANLLYRLYDVNNNALAEAGVNAETAPGTKFVTFAQSATGVAYANPSPTLSAMVTFTIFNAAGSKLGTQMITVAPQQHSAFLAAAALPGGESFTGAIAITSTNPILSLSLNAEAFTAAHPVISSMPPGDLPASTVLAIQ